MKSIKIPEEIYEKLMKRVEDSEFSKVDDYIKYILEQVIERLETEKQEDCSEEYSEEDEEKVKARLRSLGYLD